MKPVKTIACSLTHSSTAATNIEEQFNDKQFSTELNFESFPYSKICFVCLNTYLSDKKVKCIGYLLYQNEPRTDCFSTAKYTGLTE